MTHVRTAFLFASVLVAAPARAVEPPSADELALRILDGEALYTVTDGRKPVSDGFWQARFPADRDPNAEAKPVRERLAALPLGPDLEAGVLVFAAVADGKRAATAFVVHKPALRALIVRRADVFGLLGIAPDTRPQQAMERIDRGPRAARWRAFGLAFGYPEHAVEFFVSAGEEQSRTGKPVARDFVHLPTFGAARGRFVYAVPKGHAERDEDRALRTAAEAALARYRRWDAGQGVEGPAVGASAVVHRPQCGRSVRSGVRSWVIVGSAAFAVFMGPPPGATQSPSIPPLPTQSRLPA